jgi:hypothetical protein
LRSFPLIFTYELSSMPFGVWIAIVRALSFVRADPTPNAALSVAAVGWMLSLQECNGLRPEGVAAEFLQGS